MTDELTAASRESHSARGRSAPAAGGCGRAAWRARILSSLHGRMSIARSTMNASPPRQLLAATLSDWALRTSGFRLARAAVVGWVLRRRQGESSCIRRRCRRRRGRAWAEVVRRRVARALPRVVVAVGQTNRYSPWHEVPENGPIWEPGAGDISVRAIASMGYPGNQLTHPLSDCFSRQQRPLARDANTTTAA